MPVYYLHKPSINLLINMHAFQVIILSTKNLYSEIGSSLNQSSLCYSEFIMEIQWHLFPLQLVALLFTFYGWRKVGISLFTITIVLATICFKAHITDPLNIVL